MTAARPGLGTVQLGMDYGIGNEKGRPSAEAVSQILTLAAQGGVDVLDTAVAYGDSEARLGHNDLDAFRVVTKLPPGTQAKEIRPLLRQSLERLGCSTLEGLLMHRSQEVTGLSGRAVRDELCALRAEGWVRKIGASVYEGQELEELIQAGFLDLVQVPVNALDQRLVQNGYLQALKEAGVEVHARSVFLQGLLLLDPGALPEYFSPLRSRLEALQTKAAELGQSVSALLMAFVRDLPGVDVVLLGVNSPDELRSNLENFSRAASCPLSDIACHRLELIDPRNWPSG